MSESKKSNTRIKIGLTFKTPMMLPTGTASLMVKVSEEPP